MTKENENTFIIGYVPPPGWDELDDLGDSESPVHPPAVDKPESKKADLSYLKMDEVPEEILSKKPAKGRSLKHLEEGIPGPDYVSKLKKLGPRKGESFLAFHMRMAKIEAGRELLLAVGQQYEGNLSAVSRRLGINRYNLAFHLTSLGLTTADLLKYRNGHNK